MTKERYFEMCEMMGVEVTESEIPVEYSDLSLDVQASFGIYAKLRDEWDPMDGRYLGKSYAGILDIFEILEVPKEDRKQTLELINSIDSYRKKVLKGTPKTT